MTMTATATVAEETAVVTSVLIRAVPDDLHRRLRVAVAYLNESQSSLGLRAIEREVERVEADMDRDRKKRNT